MTEIIIPNNETGMKVFINGEPDLSLVPDAIMDCFVTALLEKVQEVVAQDSTKEVSVFFCHLYLLPFCFFLPFGEIAVAQPKEILLCNYKSWVRKSTNIKILLVSVFVVKFSIRIIFFATYTLKNSTIYTSTCNILYIR